MSLFTVLVFFTYSLISLILPFYVYASSIYTISKSIESEREMLIEKMAVESREKKKSEEMLERKEEKDYKNIIDPNVVSSVDRVHEKEQDYETELLIQMKDTEDWKQFKSEIKNRYAKLVYRISAYVLVFHFFSILVFFAFGLFFQWNLVQVAVILTAGPFLSIMNIVIAYGGLFLSEAKLTAIVPEET